MIDDRWYQALGAYFHPCPTRGCGRLVEAGAVNCCGECILAEEYGRDLGHDSSCDRRHDERQSTLGRKV
jgi:hypothetical protein